MKPKQYRMIHPFHSANLVTKMPKVGTLNNYRKDYKFGSEFEKVVYICIDIYYHKCSLCRDCTACISDSEL